MVNIFLKKRICFTLSKTIEPSKKGYSSVQDILTLSIIVLQVQLEQYSDMDIYCLPRDSAIHNVVIPWE